MHLFAGIAQGHKIVKEGGKWPERAEIFTGRRPKRKLRQDPLKLLALNVDWC
jgi:hypothetical protein